MKPQRRWSSVWRQAGGLVWQVRGRLAVGLLLVLVNRLAGLVLPGSSKFLIDEVLAQRRADLLPWLAAAVGAATLIQAGTSFRLSQLLSLAAQRAITETRKRVQQHVIRLPTSFFDNQSSGKLISRIMNDAEGIRNLVGTGLVQLVGGLITAVLGIAILTYLNWRLTLWIFAVLLLFGGAMAVAFRYIRPVFRERSRIRAEVTGRLAEALGGIRTVKAYRAEKHEDWVFARGAHRLYRNVVRTILAISGMTAVGTTLFGLIGVLMLLVGGRAILAGEMTLGDFVSYIFFTALVAAPMVQISSIGTQLTEAFAGLDRIRELMLLEREGSETGRRRAPGRIRGDVRFDRVTFGYEIDKPVLQNVSLEAPAGTTTALVGPSGAGKSTLIGLIMGFHTPQEGAVTVDGQDLAEIRLAEYRAQLGVVLQDNFLFDGTIAENIGYAKPEALREEVIRAAVIAHCDEFVNNLEEGYDTVVGERGVKLSGGQRQRVAIARAILADPRILILDEATSSLDSESEAYIQDGLNSLRSGRTTFVIAHRLSTIRSADQILVIEDGRIIERGTHAELHDAGGRYRQLHDKQYQLELNLFLNPGEEAGDGEQEEMHDADAESTEKEPGLLNRIRSP